MQQPDMHLTVRIESAMHLQLDEEVLPFLTKTSGDIVPQAFNSGVVYTSINPIVSVKTVAVALAHLPNI